MRISTSLRAVKEVLVFPLLLLPRWILKQMDLIKEKVVITLLNGENTLIQRVLEDIWLGDSILWAFNNSFLNKDFLDSKEVFDFIADFISKHFSLELIVYRYNVLNNSLCYFAWEKCLWEKPIAIDSSSQNSNEIHAFK